MNPEKKRLEEQALDPGRIAPQIPIWEKWGPYVSERGWGSVREDYSSDGDAWKYFPFQQAHQRAYRWCEDAIAGISDRFQVLLFAPAFWNGVDPILKERLFGLNPTEGNHGEDVKEYYYHLDATPTHSYLKYLYKYPQLPFPYEDLIETNRRKSLQDREYELIDTGILNENRYFDLFIEYAKEGPEDLCIRIEAINRGPEEAPLHILPTLWFRNQWSWEQNYRARPVLQVLEETPCYCLLADDTPLASPKYLLFDYHLGKRYFYATPPHQALFTENDTNRRDLWNEPNETPYVKDAFHRFLIGQEKGAVHPERKGSKAALHYFFPAILPGASVALFFRLTDQKRQAPLQNIEEIFDRRRREADAFYADLAPPHATEEEKQIQRQAFSGMIWNKQIYLYNVGEWIEGDSPESPPPESHRHIRNEHWRHIVSMRIFSMPDKWEYPWFAAWDLSFHALVFSLIDLDFAKHQMWLLLFDQFQHPNGAIPAYEWEFSDVNPPVQAWAILKIFSLEKEKRGREDYAFLEKCFHKLLLNFAWWVNKVDALGHNIFEGGFLGMDNIDFYDRSQKLPAGYLLDQADGSGWISLLCLNLMRMALLLARKNPSYEVLGIKFFQHFIYVTAAMRKSYWREYDLWCEEDGFFYSYLRGPDGSSQKIPIRSIVGVVPFFANDVWEEEELKQFPEFYNAYLWMLEKRASLTEKCVQIIPHPHGNRHVLSLLSPKEMKRFLGKMADPEEFLAPFGMRSLSRAHEQCPAVLQGHEVTYEPGESRQRMKGGNSNWRGPVWFPMNYLFIDALNRLSKGFEGESEIRIGPNQEMSLKGLSERISRSLIRLFQKDSQGKRPFLGDCEKLQTDPYFQNLLLFYEHFHPDTGRGLGASHQNGWTGLVAKLIDELKTI